MADGKQYRFRIKAVASATSDFSAYSTSAAPLGRPIPPILLTATHDNTGTVALTWDAPIDIGGSAITSYNLYVNTVFYGSYTGLSASIVLLYNTYTFTVKAVNAKGESDASNGLTRTVFSPPDKPTLNSATVVENTVALVWTAPTNTGGSSLTGYKIYRDGVLAVTLTNTNTSYTVTGLNYAQTYTWTVTALNTSNTREGQPSDAIVVTTPIAPPSAPTNVVATTDTTKLNVSWTASNANGSNLTSYVVKASQLSEGRSYTLAPTTLNPTISQTISLTVQKNLSFTTGNTILVYQLSLIHI